MIRPRIPYDVTIQGGHFEHCVQEVELRRRNAANLNGREGFNDDDQKRYRADLVGVCGEMALSLFTGIRHRFGRPYEHGVADVGHIEVRTTDIGKDYGLRAYLDDKKHPLMAYARLLRLDDVAIVRLEGWTDTQHAFSYGTKPGWMHRRKGECWLLAKTYLNPMDTLVARHTQAERFYGKA